MQNAKDTFYTTLQSRLAALNPSRQIVVRGVLRPATLVEENELPGAWVPVDAFRLQWTKLQVTSASPLPWVAMECAIQYATDGSSGNGGLDRGRMLAAMDAELASALSASPHTVPKFNYTGPVPTAMATNVFWADPVFGAIAAVDERLERAATVQVYAYQEAGGIVSTTVASVAPVARRVRAYFAPVNRAAGTPTLFDAAQSGRFALDAPPPPWVDLGWISAFVRKSGTKVSPLLTGAPAVGTAQVRSEIDATVAFQFEIWGKLQMTLASGSQQTNLLTTAIGAAPNGSGGVAAAPVPLLTGMGPASTESSLNVGPAAAAAFSPGSIVAVDVDYTGQLGYVGTGVSAAYVQSAAAVGSDVNFVRRVTLNVCVVASIASGVLKLADPLPAGAPAAGMQVSLLTGFCDREGASFFQEWSALFVMEGAQGDRVLYHYPRLQAMQPSAETAYPWAAPLEAIRLAGAFRALPVKDTNDGETVLCFRSYLPAAMRMI